MRMQSARAQLAELSCYADFWLHILQSLCWASATHHCCVGQQLNGNSDCTLERKSWQLLQILLSSLVRPCHVSSPQQDLHQHPVMPLLDDTKKPTHPASQTTHMACMACRCASFSLTKRRMPMQKSLRSDSKTHRAPTSRMRQGPRANTQENVKPELSPLHTDKCPVPSDFVDPLEPWLPKPGPVKQSPPNCNMAFCGQRCLDASVAYGLNCRPLSSLKQHSA